MIHESLAFRESPTLNLQSLSECSEIRGDKWKFIFVEKLSSEITWCELYKGNRLRIIKFKRNQFEPNRPMNSERFVIKFPNPNYSSAVSERREKLPGLKTIWINLNSLILIKAQNFYDKLFMQMIDEQIGAVCQSNFDENLLPISGWAAELSTWKKSFLLPIDGAESTRLRTTFNC